MPVVTPAYFKTSNKARWLSPFFPRGKNIRYPNHVINICPHMLPSRYFSLASNVSVFMVVSNQLYLNCWFFFQYQWSKWYAVIIFLAWVIALIISLAVYITTLHFNCILSRITEMGVQNGYFHTKVTPRSLYHDSFPYPRFHWHWVRITNFGFWLELFTKCTLFVPCSDGIKNCWYIWYITTQINISPVSRNKAILVEGNCYFLLIKIIRIIIPGHITTCELDICRVK